jgi:hypothetical protein
MSFHGRGPGWPVVVAATAMVVFVLGFSVSTQGPGRGSRITRINGAEAVEGEVLLKFRDGGLPANHTTIEAAADADVAEAVNRQGVRRMRSRRLRTTELIDMLASDPDVEYVEPNYVVRLALTPNDPQFPSLWGLLNTGDNPVGGGGAAGWDIHAPDAWNLSTGSRSNVIAILDTGVDYNHVDLADNIWSAPSAYQVTVGGVTITCQAGTHGFNAVTRTCNPMDDHYHGTHAAGTIGAEGNNGLGVTGVNWTASMMAVKILGSSGSGTVADAVAGLEFVMQAKTAFPAAANVRVISNSWASSGSSLSLLNAINAANSADMLFVAAAGNSGSNNDVSPVYPASYGTPNMVSVAASTNVDTRASFSNYGASSVHLAAPGVSILSTVPGNAYGVASGTSMATPHASGTALLMLSMCTLSTQQLKYLLLQNVEAVSGFAGITITGGRLSARELLRDCPYPKVIDMTLTPSLAAPQLAGTTVYWVARPEGGRRPYEFRWLVWDGATWTTAQDWTVKPITALSDVFYWTPTSSNHSYKVMAQVRSAWNTGTPDLSVSKPYDISGPVSSISLTSNLASAQPLGSTVTWTASATGGETPYEFQFKVYDANGAWSVVQPWSTSNTYSWTPGVASANYRVMAQVRGAGNTAPSGELAVWKPFTINARATSVTLTPTLTSPRIPGTSIVWWAVADGGEQPYSYQFLIWNGSVWTVARAWDTSGSFNWTPTVANANYFVAVQARSAWNSGDKEVSTSRPFSILPPVSSVSVTPDIAAPRAPGTTVTFTAAASGGQGPYQYQWSVYNGTTWTVVRAWSTNSVYAWTPTVAYAYQVKVQARSSWNTWGAERETTMPYYIGAVVTAATITPNLSSPRPRNTTIRWTASASGGEAPYEYRWTVWNGSVWTLMGGWSTSNIFDWTPTSANANYKVGVAVRSAWNEGQGELTVSKAFVIQ